MKHIHLYPQYVNIYLKHRLAKLNKCSQFPLKTPFSLNDEKIQAHFKVLKMYKTKEVLIFRSVSKIQTKIKLETVIIQFHVLEGGHILEFRIKVNPRLSKQTLFFLISKTICQPASYISFNELRQKNYTQIENKVKLTGQTISCFQALTSSSRYWKKKKDLEYLDIDKSRICSGEFSFPFNLLGEHCQLF